MLASPRLRSALALVAAAGLAGCSLYADGSDSSNATDPDQVAQCVHDTIADCYLNQLPADVCAQNVLTLCNLGGPGPGDPTCYDDLLSACLQSGGDPMLCDLRATESCNTPCDPMTDPSCTPTCQPGDPSCDPYDDCFDRTFNECVSMSGDPESCRLYAEQICGGPSCDPMTDPACPPPCTPGDPTCDPGCDPMTDPTCVPPGDCFDRVFADCLAQTNDPMLCIDVATQTCSGDPGCDPATDPMCPPPPPPPCDPMTDPSCGWPPPGCPAGDPMCPPPPPNCDPADPMCTYP